ncbi:hypothetical protein BC940DRAFT_318196 [Gongronella butleri]|nr:hypothetical protein BC940DRAFT_318196 [Gongronella butleri]
MSKEPSHPKAMNILRPTQSLTNSPKSGSVLSSYSQSRKPRVTTGAHLSSSEKPPLNIYHPPASAQRPASAAGAKVLRMPERRASVQPAKDRPPIEIYKPGTAMPRIPAANPTHAKAASMTKSYTAPLLAAKYAPPSTSASNPRVLPSPAAQANSSAHYTTPTTSYQPSFHQQQQQQNHHLHQQPTPPLSMTPEPLPANGLVTANPASTSTMKISAANSATAYADDDYSPTEDPQYTINSKEDPYDTFGCNDDQFTDDDKSSVATADDSSNEGVLIEARVNRQIKDLEISNQSLLAVNAMLEATVRKQALEVTKLKKQLTGTDTLIDPAALAPFTQTPASELSEDEWENDKVFQRLCQLTDNLIEQAQAAVAFEVKGQDIRRVISQYYAEDQENTSYSDMPVEDE